MSVTPLAGVRIETLKSEMPITESAVTPLAGVRIETLPYRSKHHMEDRHAPRGRAD